MRLRDRFSIFQGLFIFRIASNKWWTAVTLIQDGCSDSNCFQGIEPDMLELLKLKLNFTYTVTNEPLTGHEQENGSWSGIIGMSTYLVI